MRPRAETALLLTALLLLGGVALRMMSAPQSDSRLSPRDTGSADASSLESRVADLEQAMVSHAKSNQRQIQQLQTAHADLAARVAGDTSISVKVPPPPAAASNTGTQDCITAILPEGQPARTKEEVKQVSKKDRQYGMGIVDAKDKPNNLVDSAKYWETRYAMGGNSGAGSYNQIGVFKAQIVNDFVEKNGIKTIIEFGFGDGQQLTRAKYPRYIGLDVSKTIYEKTSKRFQNDPTKEFRLYDGHPVPGLLEDATLSFDVIYHLVEDEVFHEYMAALFAAAKRYVIVYSSNIEGWHGAAHVLHRDVTGYIAKTFPQWRLLGTLRNRYPERTAQDFFFYGRCGA